MLKPSKAGVFVSNSPSHEPYRPTVIHVLPQSVDFPERPPVNYSISTESVTFVALLVLLVLRSLIAVQSMGTQHLHDSLRNFLSLSPADTGFVLCF